MQLHVDRIATDSEATLGKFYIDGAFECYTLEDQYREGPKIAGETRIPAGTYRIALRDDGGKNEEYRAYYTTGKGKGKLEHKGMLHLQDVPGFEYILIHCGNYESNTEGCLLVGSDHGLDKGVLCLLSSRTAYEALYPRVRDALLGGETVEIVVSDSDLADRNKLAATTDTSRVGAVAAATAVAGAGVAAVGAAAVTGGETPPPQDATPAQPVATAAPTQPTMTASTATPIPGPAPARAGWIDALHWVLIGLGVLIAVLAIYLLVRRWSDWRRRKRMI